jgi:DNA-binding transcriptional LysR family regulator
MNLLHLEYFYTVAKLGGFTKASEALLIQQPAISRMVGQLEDTFGFKLFEKIGRNVQLTMQGQKVFENCKKIFGEVDALKTSLGKISGECNGPLTIAAAEPITSHLLPKTLARLHKSFPKIYPTLYSGVSSMLLEKIQSGEIELGLFFHVPDLSDRLIIEKTYALPFRLVVRKDLSHKKETLESFIGSREIDDSSNRKFPTLDRLKKKYPAASIKFSSNNLTAHKELVHNGLGVAILPEFLIREELKKKAFVDVFPKEKFEFNLKVIKRTHGVLSLNANKFMESFEELISIEGKA